MKKENKTIPIAGVEEIDSDNMRIQETLLRQGTDKYYLKINIIEPNGESVCYALPMTVQRAKTWLLQSCTNHNCWEMFSELSKHYPELKIK